MLKTVNMPDFIEMPKSLARTVQPFHQVLPNFLRKDSH